MQPKISSSSKAVQNVRQELRAAMKRLDLTYAALAETTGIDASPLCRFINGRHISLNNFLTLTDWLDNRMPKETCSNK